MDFDTQWDFQDPALSEARFRTLLAENPDAQWRAALETQLARALGLQRRFDEGHALLDALPLQPGDEVARVRASLERGRLYNSAGRAADARPCFAEALRLADAAGLAALAIDALHMLAIVEPAEAMAHNLAAIARAETSEDDAARRWLGSLYNNLGWTCHDAGDFDAARTWFARALAERERSGREPALRIARWAAARAMRSQGLFAEALVEQQRLLERYGAQGVDGYVFEEMAECLLALGRSDEAAPWFARAHAALAGDPWLRRSEPERLARLEQLGAATR